MAKKKSVKKKPEATTSSVRVEEQCPDTYWIALDGKNEIPITVAPMSPETEQFVVEKLAQWLWKYRHLAYKLRNDAES
jgi:hypothetical protein